MGDSSKPKQDPKSKKRSKKLELNKETVQELSNADLDQVAGGLGGLGKTRAPCQSVQIDCQTGRDETVTCPPTYAGLSCDVCPITQ